MSKRYDIGFVDPKGIIINAPGRGGLAAFGTTVPTDGTSGYAPGCTFQDVDAAFGSQFYINVGTATSCAFRAIAGPTLATVLTTTKSVAANESGKTFFLSLAGGFTSTLPAVALGLTYRFIVAVAPTTNYVITAGSAIMYGMMEERAGTAGVAGAGVTNVNLIANQSIKGDWVEFYSDGTSWFYHGMVDVSAGTTAT